MFKKILAKFGKGAATVDLRFENRTYVAGEILQGVAFIQGGEVEQKMNSLVARFMMSVTTKKGVVQRQVAIIPLNGAYTILPKEQKIIPFSYEIPKNLPISRGSVSYYFDTQLDIEGGVDRSDFDRLVIEAPKEIQNIFQAFAQLGFQEKYKSGRLDVYGQEFAFFPRKVFVDEIDEVEIRFAYEELGVRIWIEVDCRSTYREIEAKREFFVEQHVLLEIGKIVDMLKVYLTEMVNNPHVYTQPFSYENEHRYAHAKHGGHGGSPITGMIGGLAAGILGGVLLNELMDDIGFDEMAEGATEELGGDEESFFGDFFGGSEDI